jgi:hypothetical protein
LFVGAIVLKDAEGIGVVVELGDGNMELVEDEVELELGGAVVVVVVVNEVDVDDDDDDNDDDPAAEVDDGEELVEGSVDDELLLLLLALSAISVVDDDDESVEVELPSAGAAATVVLSAIAKSSRVCDGKTAKTAQCRVSAVKTQDCFMLAKGPSPNYAASRLEIEISSRYNFLQNLSLVCL